MGESGAASVLEPRAVLLGGRADSRDGAITEAGELLVAVGAVDHDYVAAMHERERSVSTYMGSLLAIPHGTNEAKGAIRRTALSVVRYPATVDWNGHPVEFVIGIAGIGDEHLALLGQVAVVFTDPAALDRLRSATTPEEIVAVLQP